jgi:serine/threonine-protein kinase
MAPMASPEPPGPAGDPLLGALVAGRYRVEALVARGGMGRIYRALQEPLGRVVALKLLTPGTEAEDEQVALQRRFLREAEICARLKHPNTVTVYDYGAVTLQGVEHLFIAMEFVDGRTLAQRIRAEGALGPERTVRLTREICRSLREAHATGVVHRDLKPSNVMLVETDDGESVKVLDFGVAKVTQQGDGLTADGSFVGSPRYSSPEQIRQEEVDARADVYALGVVMYEMLCGQPPFARAEAVRTLVAHLQDPVPPLGPRCPGAVPPVLEALVMQCLEKDRAKRPPSVDALLAALKGLDGSATLDEPSMVSADPVPQAPVAPPRRGAWIAAGAGVLGLGLLLAVGVAGAGAWWWTRPGPAPEPTVVESPLPPPVVRKVAVSSTPPGARVQEGDRVLGATPLELPVDAARTVELSLEGYHPQRVELRPGQPAVAVALVPLPAPPKKSGATGGQGGTLDIRTER